ncbi:hypothetical protein AQUCO_01800025v1 [Aquilegia coerulea]|uniref:LisH domain-containing protein n=1 Tax=Aquilegia coerulea TaxID=218851 RepID=A0A2G5DJI3_AQUCA|nr:hypothetical protein AQUCO_01800025v1 [Aquilegia coerulea]
MLEKLSEKTTKASCSCSRFAFVPRQVTLANNNNNMVSTKTLEIGNKTPTIVEPSIKKEKSKSKNKNISKDTNLLSIAVYLQYKGLINTLAALQSEAFIDELDYSEVHALDWETKRMALSKCDAKSNNKGLEELDKEGQEESKCAAAVEPKEILPESQLDKPDKKSKEKKKKKNKSISVENGGSEACSLEGKLASEKSAVEIPLNDKSLKSNDTEKENVSTLDNNTVADKKSSKKRKRIPSKGNDIQPDGAGKPTIEISEDMGKKDRLAESDGHTGKKRKVKTVQDDSSKSEINNSQVSVDNKLNSLAEGEKTPKVNDDQTKADSHGDGYLEKSGREGSATQKSTKKQQNGSAEPKTVNAFRRVKIDEVKFADDRLQDNSYWAKVKLSYILLLYVS